MTKDIRMIIPKTFKIGAQVWTVEFDDKICVDDNRGICLVRNHKIKLLKKYADEDIPINCLQSVFFHELVHAIMYVFGSGKIDFDNDSDNEKFTELFSIFLHQALATFEGDLLNENN